MLSSKKSIITMNRHDAATLNALAKYRSEIRRLAMSAMKGETDPKEYEEKLEEILKKMDVAVEVLKNDR